MMNYLSKLYELGSLPVIRPGATQKLSIGGTSAQSAPANTTLVRLLATVDCHVAFGSAPVADAGAMFLPANAPEYFACGAGDLVAAVSDSGSGALYITSAVEG